MTNGMSASTPTSLLVILDPEYGERLRKIPLGRPIWVIMSPANAPVVRSLWETRPHRGSALGITGFDGNVAANAEDNFLGNLDSIDLHHGPHSTPAPYTELEAIGVALTVNIRAALSQIGFDEFTECEEGFVTKRNKDAARRLRS